MLKSWKVLERLYFKQSKFIFKKNCFIFHKNDLQSYNALSGQSVKGLKVKDKNANKIPQPLNNLKKWPFVALNKLWGPTWFYKKKCSLY